MESHESPKQLLTQRLQELHQKGKLASHRMGELVDKGMVNAPVTMDKDKLELVITTIRSASTTGADSCWVSSMLDLGIPHDTILKIWDKKDQKSVDAKDPKNPQSG